MQVDAIIVEITENKAAQIGTTWLLNGAEGDKALGITNFSSTTGSITQLAQAGSGSTPSTSSIPQGITAAIGRLRDGGTSWAALVNALRGDADTNVVSTPQIVTLDNEEAEIKVGQQVPFVTGQFTNTGSASVGTVNPFQTIQRQEVGTQAQDHAADQRGQRREAEDRAGNLEHQRRRDGRRGPRDQQPHDHDFRVRA